LLSHTGRPARRYAAVGDGMGAYAAYTVATTAAPASFRAEAASVTRRFSDFTWLRGKLQASFPGVILYPLPEKVVTTSPFNPEFLVGPLYKSRNPPVDPSRLKSRRLVW
jgi:hypothetical protein